MCTVRSHLCGSKGTLGSPGCDISFDRERGTQMNMDDRTKPADGTVVVMSDLRLVACGDQWGAVAELEDGTEVPVWAVNGNDGPPPWLGDEKEYERYYDLALEEAHRRGFLLEGEVGQDGLGTA